MHAHAPMRGGFGDGIKLGLRERSLTHPDFPHSNLEGSLRKQPSWHLPIKRRFIF
jgi:hypothetical protein